MSRKLILASAVTLALAGTDVSALGLGGLRTQSALNQPYRGEIDLRDVKPDEIDSVRAAIASQEAFSKAGIERYYYLTKLTLTPDVTPQGRPVIRVSSKDPIREPYMDFLVKVVWPAGQIFKEYTVLLDPPALSRQGAPAVRAASAGSAAESARPRSAVVAASGRASAYIPAPGDGFPIYAGPVGNGKGLWTVARDVAPAGATVAQTAMAFYRNNQNAFIRGNINRLIAGKTLVIPSRAELFALDAGAAEREYLAALRGRAQYRAPITPVTPDMLDSRLKLAGASEPSSATAPSSTPSTPSNQPKVQQDVMLALETSESTRQETAELRDRIRELEGQLADIQTLLQLRNAELARIQSGTQAADGSQSSEGAQAANGREAPPQGEIAVATEQSPTAAAESQTGEQPPELAMSPKEAVQPSSEGDEAPLSQTETPAETTEVPVPGVLTASDDSLAGQVEGTEEEGVTGESPELIPVPSPTAPPAVGEAPVEAPKPLAQPVASQQTTASEEDTSTWHSLLLPLAGLAALTAAGIGIFSWVSSRRRREEEEFEEYAFDDDELLDSRDVTTEPRSTLVEEEKSAAGVGAQTAEDLSSQPFSMQTREGEPDSGVTLMSSLSNFDAETDEADILSEADIYIAYGRYSEAQDLLRGELQRFPERLDVKLKLAEAFASSKNLDSLTSIMEEIRAAGGHAQDPALWDKLEAARMKLQSGDRASDRPAAVVQAEHPGAGADDSFALGDSFSLDISDLQSPSEQAPSSGLGGDLDLDEVALAKKDSPAAGIGLGKEPILGDSLLDSDSFGDAVTVPVDREQPSRAGSEDSSIELVLEEHQVEDVDDLDSIFDSTLIHEPTLARDEMAGGRPTNAGAGAGAVLQGSSSVQESSDGGLSPDQESVPTDLLSSQWQIDSGIWDETATKLDLARAYIEMDDKAAAREILEEVVSEGRDEQKSEAQSLLEGLV